MANETDLLIAEYNNCAEVANHIDNVRNVITSFFLTINGGVLIVLSLVVKGEVQQEEFGSPKALFGGLVLMVCALGTLFTGTVARLRRVQSERYHIANGILDHVLKGSVRDVIPLANLALASDAGGNGLGKRLTGTYMWTLTIILPTAGLGGLAAHLIAVDIHGYAHGWPGWVLGLVAAAVVLVIEDVLYFRLSTFRPPVTTGGQSA
jgi:hypothetical protein